MVKSARALVASVVLVACGGGNDTLFAPKGNAGESGSDAGPSSGSATSSGGSSGNSSGNGGTSPGGSSATGGRNTTGAGGGAPTDGSTAAGGATAPDGSADGSNGDASDGSMDSSAGGRGGAGGAGGRASGGRGGAGGTGTGGRSGTGGKGGAPSDDGVLTPTPGVIACGSSPCTIAGTPTNVCCAGGLVTSCLPSFPGCVQFGAAVACDDAADCASGNICCRSALGMASCAKTCSGQQFCRTNDECVSGECRPFAQSPAYSSCQ